MWSRVCGSIANKKDTVFIDTFCCSDLAMILCDPYAVHTVAMSAMKAMQQSVSNEAIPRVSENQK